VGRWDWDHAAGGTPTEAVLRLVGDNGSPRSPIHPSPPNVRLPPEMTARLFRAPALSAWLAAAAAICLAAGPTTRAQTAPPTSVPTSEPGTVPAAVVSGVPASEPAATQSAAPSGKLGELYRPLKVFDFNERDAGNYEDAPMFWKRFTGDGLPAYSKGAFDEALGHAAPPSFRFNLRGGNIAYEYAYNDLTVFPDSDYLIEAYVRAEGLQYARAFLAAYLVDGFGRRIAGSERVSTLISSAPDEQDPWQRVELTVSGDYPDARLLRLQLWVLQRYVWHDPGAQAVDPILRQDVQAEVWFDDITIFRMPRVQFRLSNAGGIVAPGTSEAVELDVSNATAATVHAEVDLVDSDGRGRLQRTFELAAQAAEHHRVPVPDLPPGLYHAHLRLMGGGDTLVRRGLQFVVLPELKTLTVTRPDIGMNLGRWPADHERGVYELTRTLEACAVKVGVPMIGSPGTEGESDYLRQIADLARQLGRQRIATTAVILSPATSARSEMRRSLRWMLQTDEQWESRVGPVFAFFGGQLTSWQLGSEAAELAGPDRWTADAIEQIRQRLERFVAAPELILPCSVLDTAPLSDDAENPAPLPAREQLTGPPLHAYSYWVGPELPTRALPHHLAFWGEEDPGGPRAPQRWLSLAFDDTGTVSPTEHVADLARRVIFAKAANPDLLYLPAPYEPDEEVGADGWQPTADYIPLRTLVHYLSGQHAVASLALGPDVVALLFDGDRRTLVLWTWIDDDALRQVSLYVGAAAHAIDLFGREQCIEMDGALAHIPVTRTPLLVENVNTPLLRIQDSFRLEPPIVQLHDPDPRPVLKLRNHYASDLSGEIVLTGVKEWEIRPNPIRLALPPGETLEQTLEFVLPPRQIATPRQIGIDVRLEHPEPQNLHFDVTLEIALKGIIARGQARWDGDALVVEYILENRSDQPVNFNAFCQPLGRARQEQAFLNVPPGEARTQQYRFLSARDLAGSNVWLGLEEIGGRRTLDQLVVAPR